MRKALHGLRQRRHHPEFRIGPPAWDLAELARLERLAARFAEAEAAAESTVGSALDDKALADAVTNLWSAQRVLDRMEGRPPREVRQAGRYLRNARDALAEAELTVQEHDGQAFNPGLSLQVLLYSDEQGLSTETVVETVRPSIYLGDRRIQMGQVIVGRPAGSERGMEDASA